MHIFKHTHILFLATLSLNTATAAPVLQLTEADAVHSAITHSPLAAQLAIETAETQATAKEAGTLENPSIEVDATVARGGGPRTVGLEIEQPLLLSSFGSRPGYARALRDSASLQEQAQLLELQHSVKRAYTAHWILQEHVSLQEQALAYMQSVQASIEGSLQAGRTDIADAKIFNAETRRSEIELKALQAKHQRASVELIRFLGIAGEWDDAVLAAPSAEAVMDLETVQSIASDAPTVRRLLQVRERIAQRRLNVANQDAWVPEFSPRAVIERDMDANRTSMLVGVNVSLPIWDRNNAERLRAKAEARLAKRMLAALSEQSFERLLSTAHANLVAAHEAFAAYQAEIVPAWEEAKTLMQKRFNNGQLSMFDLWQIQERFKAIKLAELQAAADLLEARINLETLLTQTI